MESESREGPTTAGFDQLDQGRTLQIETPEHVQLDFDLAGVGSRAMAAIADYTIMALFLLTIGILFSILDRENELLRSIGGAWLTFLVFLLQTGYFFAFELLSRGQTPGKRSVGLRVISVEGTPVTVRAAALRNLFRVIDLQPVFSGMTGLGMIAATGRGQRIGDIIAGTIVVRDKGGAEIPESTVEPAQVGRPVLSAEQFDLLDRYILRREGLTPQVRRKISARVSRALGAVVHRRMDLTRHTLDDQLTALHREERSRQLSGLSPQAVRFFAERRDAWRQFDELVARADQGGLSRLQPEEVELFTGLYREVGADLARARTYGGSLRLRFELERRVAAGHNLFYHGRSRGPGFGSWVRRQLPRDFRRNWRLVALSALLLFGPALLSWGAVRMDPELGAEITSPVMLERAETAAQRIESGDQYVDIPASTMPMFSSQIMTNNLRVALTTAAGGILAGLGTLMILVMNGVHLGSSFGVFYNADSARLLWDFVLPHGVIELTAIVIAGAAGLMIGGALLMPGRRTRADALREEGITAAGLTGGALVLLVIAGLIEGYISPAAIPVSLKYAFSALVGAITFLYLGTSGRGTDPVETQQATEGPVP